MYRWREGERERRGCTGGKLGDSRRCRWRRRTQDPWKTSGARRDRWPQRAGTCARLSYPGILHRPPQYPHCPFPPTLLRLLIILLSYLDLMSPNSRRQIRIDSTWIRDRSKDQALKGGGGKRRKWASFCYIIQILQSWIMRARERERERRNGIEGRGW